MGGSATKNKHYDELCVSARCPNIEVCLGLCPPLAWIDGRERLRAVLLKEPIDQYQRADYNAVIASLAESREVNHLERIRTIPDTRQRAIAAMIDAWIGISDVAGLLHVTRQHLHRIVKQGIPWKTGE